MSGLNLPQVAVQPLQLMASAALPAALFGIGGILVAYRPEGDARGIALVCGISLLVHPAWVWGMGNVLALSEGSLRAAVLTSAMAPGVNSYLFASMHGRAVRISASAVLVGTGFSVMTVSAWLYVL